MPPVVPTPAGSSNAVNLVGSSLVQLQQVNPDDAPTIITSEKPTPPPSLSTLAMAGQKLGHFELIEAVGAGGMATVLKARDLELGRTVALKILPPETARDSEVVTRFKQEARAAAKLDHDNIARVYFCGEDQGLHFIAFEFVEGVNLRTLIERQGTIPPADCIRYMLQVAAGLGHAAERGVVHRDVKPSNILITPEGKAKIVDMGLARHLESHSVNGGVTQSGVTLGTFDYISPEQALDPRRADVRSDIYSLGCTFYHALTGRPPVPEGTAAKKLQAHQHDYPLDPRELNPKVPDALAVVLSKMMAKNPDRRYQTPADLIRDLVGIAREWSISLDGILPDSAASTLPVPTPLLPEPPRLPIGWLLAGAAVVAAAAIFFTATGPSSTSPAWNDDKPVARIPVQEIASTTTPPAAAPTGKFRGDQPVADVASLAAAIKNGESKILLRRGRTYDLTTLTEPVIFTGAELSLEAITDPDNPDPTRPCVIRVAAVPAHEDGMARPGGLTIRGSKRVKITGVAFEVTTRGEIDPLSETEPFGVALTGCEQAEFIGCRFRLDPAAAGTRLTGLSIASGAHTRHTQLTLHHALIDLGTHGVGVRLSGGVSADVRQAAFAPQEAGILLAAEEGRAAADGNTELRLRECTFMLESGSAAIETEAGVTSTIEAGYSVFAASTSLSGGMTSTMPGATDSRPVVLRVTSETPGNMATRFISTGQPNAYYRVAAFATTSRGYTFEEAQALSPTPINDPTAVQLKERSPWDAPNPRTRLATDPEQAFRLNLNDRKVHLTTDPWLLGAKLLRSNEREARIYTESWPPAKPKPPVEARASQVIYWPDAEASDARDHIYSDFLAAFTRLEPGDTLLVAANGPVSIPALPEKENLHATIKAYPGFAPELISHGTSRLRDACLFKLTDGDLVFEGLSINLTARQAIVGLSGGRGATFRNCQLTLDEKEGDIQAAVTIADPAREMRMGPSEVLPSPQVRFENTLVRGKGRAVWVQAARPFDLAVDNSAFALDGPLLDVDSPAKDLPASPPAINVRLTRITAILNGPILELQAPRDTNGRLVQLNVETDRCLFAPTTPTRPKPLVVVDGVDMNAELKKYVTWSSRGSSTYANYFRLTSALEMRPALDEGSSPVMWSLERWMEFARENSTGLKVKFAGGPIRGKLAALKPADLRAEVIDPETTAPDTGATVTEVGPIVVSSTDR